MTPEFLELLRCPLDPERQSRLTRERDQLTCDCGVRFPIKNGLPVLVADEVTLPEGCASRQALPCQRRR